MTPLEREESVGLWMLYIVVCIVLFFVVSFLPVAYNLLHR